MYVTAARDPRSWLAASISGILLLLLVGAVAPGTAVGPTYLADVVAIVTLIAMVVLWVMCPNAARLSTVQRTFLACGFLAWAGCVVQVLRAGYPTQPALLLMGALLGLALLRAPDASGSAWLLDLLAIGVACVSLVVLLLEVVGLEGSWYQESRLDELLAWERATYWTPVADLLGLDGRWAGPFDHPGRAGQVGALLLVWGATRRGWRRGVLVPVGGLMVLLAGSNTAYLSVACGAAVLVVAAMLRRLGRVPHSAVLVVSGVAVLAVGVLVALVLRPNIGLTGRTEIWPTYLELWRSAPWTGIGATGIAAAQFDGLLPSWAYHAHNSWLDLLARHGAVVFALSVAAIAAAVIAAVQSARRGSSGSLAIATVLLVASLTQPMIVWVLPTVPMTMLVLAVLASTTRGRGAPGAGRSRVPDRPSTGDRASRAASSGAADPS